MWWFFLGGGADRGLGGWCHPLFFCVVLWWLGFVCSVFGGVDILRVRFMPLPLGCFSLVALVDAPVVFGVPVSYLFLF